MKITVTGSSMSEAEQREYISLLKKQHPDKIITELEIKIDGDFVDLKYSYEIVPFQRIRRITGYLVGTLDRFNNAKFAEVGDRVKHG
jgi:anaerobic ribonucleoside-triphosphate reductase